MAVEKSTIWALEPHTRAKHEILKRYLQAWMPILSQGGFPEILYVDGFAGPGVYSEGEDGSPIIALKTALGYSQPLRTKLHFLFIEKDKQRADHLHSIINDMVLPSNFVISVEGGKTFEEAFKSRYNEFVSRLGKLPPTFAFIDPFGWKGVPFEIIVGIMAHPNCEVFINFMYEEMNRFLNHPDQVSNFDIYFGTNEWRRCVMLTNVRQRNECLHGVYMNQIHVSARASLVRSFEMRNASNVVDYYLFYATNSLIGLKRMKEAMWKVDDGGEFRFSDATDPNQLILFEKKPDFGHLRHLILQKFAGFTTTVGDIERFVLCETAFRETHYKVQVLRPLELEGMLEVVDAPPDRRKGTYGNPQLKIRFLG